MKRILSLILCLLIIIASVPMVFADADMPSSWSTQAIDEMKGYGQFRSAAFKHYKGDITRLEFVYIAVKVYELLKGEEIVINSGIAFTDTTDIYALKGATVGITNGVGEGKFGPSRVLTREQLATMMVKIFILLGIEMNEPSALKFQDDGLISSWAKEAIYRAQSNNIISGVGNNKVDPLGVASTEMALVIANRILKNNGYTPAEPISSGFSFSESLGKYTLNESSSALKLWTDYPSERIFKDDLAPSETASGIDVYLA